MATRRPFWKWRSWKSTGFCLWPPSTCIWNLKLKFQRKLDLCSGNHVVYRQTDGRTDIRTDKVNPVYPPSNFVERGFQYTPPPTSLGRGIMMVRLPKHICVAQPQWVNKFRPVENIFNHILLNNFDLSIQHCFMWWLGAWWQQTITWTIVGQDVWHHTASLGHNRLNPFNVQSIFEKYSYIEGTRRVDGNADILSHPGP